jgi:hypothetical protein
LKDDDDDDDDDNDDNDDNDDDDGLSPAIGMIVAVFTTASFSSVRVQPRGGSFDDYDVCHAEVQMKNSKDNKKEEVTF